jgi:DNA-binding MarR family transcriptional regulator
MKKAGIPSGEADSGELGELSTAWNTGGPDYLSLRIGFVAKLIERHTARTLAEKFGTTLAEWRVLAQLARVGPMTVRALADRSWVDRAEVSRAAASLTRRGCVEQAANPADRRSPYFLCTAEGGRLYRKIKPTRDSFQQLLASQVPPARMENFLDLLYRLTRCLAPQVPRSAGSNGRRPNPVRKASRARSRRRRALDARTE